MIKITISHELIMESFGYSIDLDLLSFYQKRAKNVSTINKMQTRCK